MFILLEDKVEKEQAQLKLRALAEEMYQTKRDLKLGWLGSNRQSDVHTDGRMWYRYELYLEGTVERWLNWFGYLNDKDVAHIAVEINVPTESNSSTVSGFFAREPASGALLLMHDGGIGGGQKGIGKHAYLAWANHQLIEVVDSKGNVRAGIIVANLNSNNFQVQIERFVDSVKKFKTAIHSGLSNTKEFQRRQKEYREYRREFSGRKRGSRAAEIDYISRHGDVVEALKNWRKGFLNSDETVTNTSYIDLIVIGRASIEKEIFEVKTGCTRGHIYTAIGQLMAHSATRPCAQTIVLPSGERLPEELAEALEKLGIRTVRFSLSANSVTILGYSQTQALPEK